MQRINEITTFSIYHHPRRSSRPYLAVLGLAALFIAVRRLDRTLRI